MAGKAVMLSRWFQTRERVGGESFVTLVDNAPVWLRELVYELHDGELPNDWRHEVAREIAVAIDEAQSEGDEVDPHTFADSLTESATFDLLTWLRDNLARVGDVDAANEDYGWSTDQGVAGMIRVGQYVTIRTMVERFLEALEYWDDNHADEFTCAVHEDCPTTDGADYSDCYRSWKAAQQ